VPLLVNQTPRARIDLLDIWDYIATDNENAADKLIERIGRVFDMLAHQPFAGRARPELRADLRSFPVGNYIVIYRPDDQALTIVRVLESHRDIEAEFNPS
jgi:toxin ParE1/3/4